MISMEKKGLSKGWIIFIIIAALVLIMILWIVVMYNGFVTLSQNVDSKWSEVESQYQRQADLIPNVVSAVSSAVSVETKFVKDVIDARTKWQDSKSDRAGVEMTNGITAFVNAVAENYPQLQANKQYTALIDELAGTQNRITTARGRYIEAIQSYNTATMRFPGRIFAGMFGFAQKEYYTAQLDAMKTPVLGTGVLP